VIPEAGLHRAVRARAKIGIASAGGSVLLSRLSLEAPMKSRIGLVIPQHLARSKTTYVDVSDVDELAAELVKIGAKRVALFWRDRTGDGHVDGEPFAVSEVTKWHFIWAATPPQDGMRGFVCDMK
jgi:hypothetical protein